MQVRTVMLAVLCLAGCARHRAELTAALAEREARLERARERADGLNELRVEVAALEARVRRSATTPESRGLVSAALDEAPALPTRAVPPPTLLPPEGAFEGVEGARLRAEIAESEQRLAMLEQVLVEVDQLQARRARAQATSALLESLGGELK